MQSKYQVAPLNQKLKSLNKAIVTALPCQVHGIRKYIKLNKGAKKKIYLTIGLYCHFNSTKECIDFILSKLRIQKKDIKKIDYRAGAWPGGLRVTLKNGHSRFIKKFSYHFTVPFFIPERCKTLLQLFVDLYRRSVGQITGTDPVETALANFGHVVDVFYNPDNPIARLWKEQIKRLKDLRNLEV